MVEADRLLWKRDLMLLRRWAGVALEDRQKEGLTKEQTSQEERTMKMAPAAKPSAIQRRMVALTELPGVTTSWQPSPVKPGLHWQRGFLSEMSQEPWSNSALQFIGQMPISQARPFQSTEHAQRRRGSSVKLVRHSPWLEQSGSPGQPGSEQSGPSH